MEMLSIAGELEEEAAAAAEEEEAHGVGWR